MWRSSITCWISSLSVSSKREKDKKKFEEEPRTECRKKNFKEERRRIIKRREEEIGTPWRWRREEKPGIESLEPCSNANCYRAGFSIPERVQIREKLREKGKRNRKRRNVERN